MHLLELSHADVLMHAGIGTVFAGTGACVRGLCAHTHAQHYRVLAFIIGAILVLVESIFMVWLVG